MEYFDRREYDNVHVSGKISEYIFRYIRRYITGIITRRSPQ